MEFLLLGLLMLSPMTGYELQQFIKNNLTLICSRSAGSVQFALTKLEREGFIISNESMEGKRRKKRFSLRRQDVQPFSVGFPNPCKQKKPKIWNYPSCSF